MNRMYQIMVTMSPKSLLNTHVNELSVAMEECLRVFASKLKFSVGSQLCCCDGDLVGMF